MFLSPSTINVTAHLAHPLTPDFLLRKVLIPETALGLIAEDLNKNITDPDVRHTLETVGLMGKQCFQT